MDNVGVLHDFMRDELNKKIALSEKDFEFYFSLMYSLYSFPNIILPFVGGLLISFIGNRKMYIYSGLILVVGQFLFSIGYSSSSIIIMLMGRSIFGLAGEVIGICQNVMIVKWFKANELTFPFSIVLVISRLGSISNDVFSPRIASTYNTSTALWAGLSIQMFSLATILIMTFIDSYYNDDSDNTTNSDEDKINFSFIYQLPKIFRVLACICFLLYGGFIPFNNIAASFLTQGVFKDMPITDARNKAGFYMSIPFIIGIILIPILGILGDKFDRPCLKSISLLFSSITGLSCFFMFTFTTPFFPLILLGITYSLFSSVIWPAIAIISTKETVGLSFGINTSLQNLGLSVFPIIVALILKSNNYNYVSDI